MSKIDILSVDVGSRSYQVVIGEGLLARAGEYCRAYAKRGRCAIITDDNLAASEHLAKLQEGLGESNVRSQVFTIPAGEASKCMAQYERLLYALLDGHFERADPIIALGGGVVGDLAGFVSASFRRGTPCIQIPTSLLAQVDSSVGGKTGINAPQGKNLIGAFHQPVLVLADIDTLDSLPKRELLSGYAEVLKYALIGDRDFFNRLQEIGTKILSGGKQERREAIYKSCRAKAAIVASDETEQGERALLNFGHTFGHALESATGYGKRLLHGEAVSIGMMLAFEFSHRLGLCQKQDIDLLREHLHNMKMYSQIDQIAGPSLEVDTLEQAMLQDKKISDGKLTLILTRGIGKAFIERNVECTTVTRFLNSVID